MGFSLSGRKGQVTIYVILGIVIVAALIGAFVFRDYVLKSEFERQAEKLETSEEIKVVYDYFVDCIGEVTYDGLTIIASQGGRLNIDDYNYPVNPLVPFTNRLDVFNNKGLGVPYWFYETSNGIQEINVPTIENIQKELNDYVSDNINVCANNFTLFEEYNIRGFDEFNVETEIKDNQVYVKVDSELTINYKEVEQNIESLYIIVDTDFGLLFNNAVNLFRNIYQQNFIEEKTIDMLVLYDELPFSFTEFSCERKVWNKQQVIEDLKKILELNTHKYHLTGDDYFSLKSDINSDVYFSYSNNWPFYIDIGPSEENILKSDELSSDSLGGSFLRGVFCINDYKFIYNIKYPVLIKLSSDLDFLFAYQVIIKNNQAKVNLVEQSFDIETSKLCDSRTMPTQVNTYDDNLIPLGNAKVEFKCFDTICDIGYTDINGYLSAEFPQCLNGLIITSKEEYNNAELLSSTNIETQNSLIMDRIRNLEFEIKLIENGIVRNVNNDETAQILLNGPNGYQTSIDENLNTIGLISGNYEVSSFVTKEDKIKIEKQKIQECTSVPKKGLLGLIFKEDRCFDIEVGGFDLDNVIIGGNNFEFNVNKEGLNNRKIIFYANVYEVPDTQDEILEIYDNIDAGGAVNSFRYPEYEN
jgi:hypothetical protein